MASQYTYIKPESLQNHSFHLGSGSSRTKVNHTTTIPTKGQNCISASLSLSPHSMQLAMPHPSTKATNGTIDIAIYTKELCHSYTDTAPISRNAPSQLLQSTAVPQAIKLHPSRGAPKRRRRAVAVAKEHLLCSRYDCSCRQIRFRMIYLIPSLVNRRGNNLHTVDICCK